MIPYKLKHIPTGLYYQPHKHRGSNISARGKIYQTKIHGLSSAFRRKNEAFRIYCEKDSQVHKLTKDTLKYIEHRWSYNQVYAETNISDWICEDIKIGVED